MYFFWFMSFSGFMAKISHKITHEDSLRKTKTNPSLDVRMLAHRINESNQPVHDHVTLAVSSKEQPNKLWTIFQLKHAHEGITGRNKKIILLIRWWATMFRTYLQLYLAALGMQRRSNKSQYIINFLDIVFQWHEMSQNNNLFDLVTGFSALLTAAAFCFPIT